MVILQMVRGPMYFQAHTETNVNNVELYIKVLFFTSIQLEDVKCRLYHLM
jgi:hypothetical protein